MGTSLHPVATVGEIPPGGRKIFTVGKISLGIFNVGGAYFAYRNICPHAGAPVCEGQISGTTLPSPVYEYKYGREGCILRCPWHGWEFDLQTGEHLVDSDTRLKNFPVSVTSRSSTDKPMNANPHTPEGTDHEKLERFSVEHRDNIIYIVLPGSGPA